MKQDFTLSFEGPFQVVFYENLEMEILPDLLNKETCIIHYTK